MTDKQHMTRRRVADVATTLAKPQGGRLTEDEDHIYLDFRVLSARLIKGYWLDFPAELLKAAAALLKGMPVMLNHSANVEKVVGTVLDTWWSDELRHDAPGIDAHVRLDKLAVPPGLLRQMTADPPLKAPVSVTWFGEAERSHPDLTNGEFWALLGQEHNGEVVRWVATEIDEMPELSLVWAGADKGARALAHPGMNVNLGQPWEGQPDGRSGDMDAKNIVTLAALAPLGQALALTPDQMTAEKIVAQLEAAVKKLQAEVAALKPMAKAGQAHLAAVRAEALRLAAATREDKTVPEALQKVIEGADLATAQVFLEQFGGKVGATFSAVCPKCGTLASIRSSFEEEHPAEQLHGQDDPEKTGGRMATLVNE